MKYVSAFLVMIFIGQLSSFSQYHPWQMFNGEAHHRGDAAVKGPQTANLKWKYFLDYNTGPRHPGDVIISSTGTVYVCGLDSIFAFSPDGQLQRKLFCHGCGGPALSHDGTRIYASSDTMLIAMDTLGNQKWTFPMGDQVIFACTIGEDSTIYKGSWAGTLYAINPDGSQKWAYPTDGCISYAVTLGPDGTIYQGGGDAHCHGGTGEDSTLYAINPLGGLKWRYATGAFNRRTGTPAIGHDGKIYVPTGKELHVLDTAGNFQWGLGGMTNEVSGIISPAITSTGQVYVGNSAGLLSAIDPNIQDTLWTYQTGPDIDSSSVYGLISFFVVDNEGTVFAGSVDRKMHAVDKDGNVKWTYLTDDQITEASPAIGPDGTLYFTSSDGYVYAIGDSVSTQIADVSFHNPSISVYPNPVGNDHMLNILIGSWGSVSNKKLTVEVINVLGSKVISDTEIRAHTSTLDLGNVDPGLYLCRFISGQKVVFQSKIVITE